MRLCIRLGKMPRKEFITKFPGNEANLSWVTELAKSDEPWAEKVANQEIDILALTAQAGAN